jgi:uncharacterized RDD family membrane protein YckC
MIPPDPLESRTTTHWSRRVFAFALDISIVTQCADLTLGQITGPLHPGVDGLVRAGFWFAYLVGFERTLGRSAGMALFGIHPVGPEGGRPSLRATLGRGAMVAAILGLNPAELLDLLGAGRIPPGIGLAASGADMGYLMMAIATMLFRRDTCLLHDLWSGTRVVRREAAAPAPSVAPAPAWNRLVLVSILACAVLALPLAAWSDHGFDWKRLVRTPEESDPEARAIERRIASRLGVRSKVSGEQVLTARTGKLPVHALQIRIQVPWAAFNEERATQMEEIAAESLRADPRRFGQLDIIVSSSVSGLLNLKNSLKWSWDFDSTAVRWRAVDRSDP